MSFTVNSSLFPHFSPNRGASALSLFIPVLLLVSVFFLFSAPVSGEMDREAFGTELAQKVYDRPGGKDAVSRVTMILADKDNKGKSRVMYSYSKDKGDAERWTLLRFIQPKDVDRTGLLTLDYKGNESQQWLYLPALDRVRRISSSRKGGRFVGSDFFYEDLMDREVDMDRHKYLGRSKLGGISTYVLESVPSDPDNSVYTRRVTWIHPKLLLPLRVEFYQKGGEKPVKRLQAKKIRKVQGYWTVFESTMYNLNTGHRTVLQTDEILYDQSLPDDLFSQRALADDAVEKAYRPE